MFKRLKKALAPSKNKWFDINDVKVLAGAGLALVGAWAMVTLTIAIF